MQRYLAVDLTNASGRALVEERYWSLRRQVPIVYLLGFVNLAALELAATGRIKVGPNLPTFIGMCGIIRAWHWFGSGTGQDATHSEMVKRLTQTVWFATAVCLAVCARCLYLFQSGNAASDMAVMLFGGLTAIGVAYGLTALPAAGFIPLFLIIGPISVAALYSQEPHFAGAAFGLVVVAGLTMRLLAAHNRHFTDLVRSRSAIAREQELVEEARQEAVVAATTDFLTGLPNRRAFVAALESVVDHDSAAFAVAILDLDRFKVVNDTFGHATGDQLLKEVARRLLVAVGDRGAVARLGGDEFGILLPGVARSRDAHEIGNSIVEAVNGPAIINGGQFVIAACCGVGVSRRKESKSPSRIMADADLALYQAKYSPISNVATFELRMEAPRARRAQIESALLAPGVCQDLRVVFQPIFDLRTGGIVAQEALARWLHPDIGSIPPSEFVPIAEHLHLIDDINNHLMAIAFEHACNWENQTKISFNLSAIQLCSRGTAKAVLGALKRAGLSPHRLQVEVTETALLADFERARENLMHLRRSGATIVLDDFGAGYASIGYLRQIRFDQIKLDGGLVTAAQQSLDGRRLLRAVIGLCELLGVSSIAEHVESEELLRLVTDLGCSAAQGYWLGSPVEPADLKAQTLASTPQSIAGSRRAA